jgi:hypothetical protein
MTRRILLDNQSTGYHDAVEGVLDRVAMACEAQLHELARAHSDYVFQIVDEARGQGWHIALLDDADQAGALGYHDVGPDGKPYSRVFVSTILDNGGTLIDGAFSVSACVSHEMCEMIGDPGANRWANDSEMTLWAFELADAVENDFYQIDDVSMSNFLWPAYFQPLAPSGSRFDQMGLVGKPFEVRPGGYAIYWDDNGIGQTFGDQYPDARRATKDVPGARTYARMR